MKKHKSKTNIMNDDKQAQKFITMMKKQKNKNQNCRKSTAKLGKDQNKIQTKLSHPQKTTNMHSKTKSYLEKMTIILPQQNLKSDIQSFSATQRRKSASVIPQRVDSRLSKRGSVASNKSNKEKKTQNLKENDKNGLNLQQVEELQNQEVGTTSKKNSKKLQIKKKNELNLNTKTKFQHPSHKPQKKDGQKSKNYQEFEKKMSRYLESKDIFSRNISRQKSNHSKQSKKSSSKKNTSEKDIKFQQQKPSGILKSKQRQNLLEIYQFYKKTFDINFNNCFKRGKNFTKVDKNSQNSSKSALKPFYSSIVVDRHQNSANRNDLKPFFQTNNQTKISVSGILNENDQSKKSKRSGSISICNKENQSKLKLLKSSLINSRSKSNINSDSSTKDNLFYWKGDQQNIDQNIIDEKKSKKSYKDFIVFNQKLERSFPNKQVISQKDFENIKKSQKLQQVNELSKISIGQSNIEVLKWSCNQEKMYIKNQPTKVQKNQEKSLQKEIFTKQKLLESNKSIQKESNNFIYKIEIFQQKNNVKPVNVPQFEEQNLDVTKLIKKRSKEDQFGNLDDLSSISLINDRRDGTSQNPFSTSPKKNPAFLNIDAIDFQL